MEGNGRVRILCVDDEQNVLEGLKRQLRRHCAVETAGSGAAGLETLQRAGPFTVAVSDLQMPTMNGVAFLGQVRAVAPDTVRILLTGNADLTSAIDAVNEGHIFRFLTKPCAPEVLIKAIAAAAEQHRLITAERVLLEETLHGSIKALTDVLALTNPAAFGRATRVKQAVSALSKRLDAPDRWQVEVAAMLSQIGCVTLPPELAEKLYHGQTLTPAEQAMVARLPAVAEQLLGHIPRLDTVRQILLYQDAPFDGTGTPPAAVHGEQIPLGARLLKVALDFDTVEAQGMHTGLALDTLRGRMGWYDPTVLEALIACKAEALVGTEVREVPLRELCPGMVFAEDLTSSAGVLLVARGQEVTASLVERLRNFSPRLGVQKSIRVVLPAAPDQPSPEPEGAPAGADA